MAEFHLHLISDATGETLNTVTQAALAQFEGVDAALHTNSLVRSTKQLASALQRVANTGGLVLYTMVSTDLRQQLEEGCRELDVPCIAVIDPALSAMAQYFGRESLGMPGQQHQMDADYFSRIDAIQYTLSHDDGQKTDDLHHADVILVGVSRTSKTPTCMYLANRGLKAANIPIVPNAPLPPELEGLKRVLIVGLTTHADRLVHVRQSRLRTLAEPRESAYADPEQVEDEVTAARREFNRRGWPVIDVTRRSIEETAAAVYNLHLKRQEQLAIAADLSRPSKSP